MEKPRVSLLVPAYNERENVPELFSSVGRFLRRRGLRDWELVFVDDGSTDGTWEEARRLAPRYPFVRLVRHRRNFGLTQALLTGARAARGGILVFFPADLQYDIEDVARMVEHLEAQKLDLVAGWKQGDYEKKFVSAVYNWFSRKLFRLPVHDLNSVKVFRREVMENLLLRKDWHRYIIPMAVQQGFRVGEIPVRLYPRRHGVSKFRGMGRVLVGLLDLVAVKFQMTFMRKPMLFFGTLGLFSLLIGFLITGVALYLRFVLHHGYRPLGYAILFFLLAGLLFFAMGFLGELVAGLYDLLSQRKEVSVVAQEETPGGGHRPGVLGAEHPAEPDPVSGSGGSSGDLRSG